MTGDGVRFFSFLAVYVGNYVETDKNASEGVLDILCRIPGASYIFYVFLRGGISMDNNNTELSINTEVLEKMAEMQKTMERLDYKIAGYETTVIDKENELKK